MNLKEIRQVVELMNENGLSLFRIEKEDFSLELQKGGDLEAMKSLLETTPFGGGGLAPPPTPAAIQATSEAASVPTGKEQKGEAFPSPMVGTLYLKPSPDEAPFVNAGDSVNEGKVLCIIEAMKVMNEIKAEKAGTVIEICVEDGNPVQFGDALFYIQ